MSSIKNSKSILPGDNQQKPTKQIGMETVLDNIGALPKKDSKTGQHSTKATNANTGIKKIASSSASSLKRGAAPISGGGKFGQLALSTKTTSASRFPNQPATQQSYPTQMEAGLQDAKDIFEDPRKDQKYSVKKSKITISNDFGSEEEILSFQPVLKNSEPDLDFSISMQEPDSTPIAAPSLLEYTLGLDEDEGTDFLAVAEYEEPRMSFLNFLLLTSNTTVNH